MTNHTFYTSNYLKGKEAVLDAASFPFWERKAAGVVRKYTFGNINESAPIPEAVQLCVCEVAELLYRQESNESKLASERVGEYSVTYKAQTSAEKSMEAYVVVSNHLATTGLMYCGV